MWNYPYAYPGEIFTVLRNIVKYQALKGFSQKNFSPKEHFAKRTFRRNYFEVFFAE